MYRVHNSTVARQLRYALTKERLYCRAVTPAAYAPYAVTESFFVEKFNIGKSRNILFCKRSSGKYFNVSRF